MKQDAGKECQREADRHGATSAAAAAGHTPLTPLNSQLRSVTVTLSPAF